MLVFLSLLIWRDNIVYLFLVLNIPVFKHVRVVLSD